MTNTTHHKSARSTIVFGAVAGLALVAGLAVRVDGAAPSSGPGTATESQAIAGWAGSQGLSGLSPASLSAAPRSAPALDVQIAEWARSQGLSGLSPASLAPVRS
jgi:hypothetical protein